jgi:hypothetical protein
MEKEMKRKGKNRKLRNSYMSKLKKEFKIMRVLS